MRRTVTLVAAVCTLITLAAPGWSSVPVNINIQGRLTDQTGEPLPAGIKGCNFAIFDAETGGTQVWPTTGTEAHLVHTGEDGLWQATLGSVVALPYTVFADTSRWLEVTMDDGVNPPEVFSRIKVNSLPYAYRAFDASMAEHADSASTVADYCIHEDKLADLSVTSQKLGNDAVTNPKIAPDAVTSAKLAPDAVTSDKIQNGSVQFADLAPNGAAAGDVMMWDGSQWIAQNPIPAGVILMWSGALSAVPEGWALCDGSGGRPDLRDRFIFGWSPGVNPGQVGGQVTHTHGMDPSGDYREVWGLAAGWAVTHTNHIHNVHPAAHMPPYYRLAFIIKL